MLLTHFVIGKLYSGITIFLYCTDLRVFFPSAPKTEVIPIFFPINPGIGLLINCLLITYPPQYIFAGCKYTINFLIFNILGKHFSSLRNYRHYGISAIAAPDAEPSGDIAADI